MHLYLRELRYLSENELDYFIAYDTTSRGGHIGSITVSFLSRESNTPKALFVKFDLPSGHGGSDFASGISNFARSIPRACLMGISTDGPNVMIGHANGTGAILNRMLDRFIRHDVCELHASATLLRVLERTFPAHMNVRSVSQFSYCAWYILNSDWKLFQSLMVSELSLNPRAMSVLVKDWLSNQGGTIEYAANKMIDELKKPEKPNTSRWGTYAHCIQFVCRFLPLLQRVFDLKRQSVGIAKPGSVAAMCSQWLTWSACRQLRALLVVASEFVDLWLQHDKRINQSDEDYGCGSCFRVFGRTLRAFDVLSDFEQRLKHYEHLPSFSIVCNAFQNDGEVHSLYRELYSCAVGRIRHNNGRYFSGVYAFSSFGDPHFAFFAWEAFSHWKKHRNRPEERTAKGLMIEAELQKQDLDEYHCRELEKLTTPEMLSAAFELVQGLGPVVSIQGAKEFVSRIVNCGEQERNRVVLSLASLRAAMSHTQHAEHSFRLWDTQSAARGSGGKKAKASAPRGSETSVDLMSAKVSVAKHFADVERNVAAERNLKRPRVQKLCDVAVVVSDAIRTAQPTEYEFSEAYQEAQSCRENFVCPRKSISRHMSMILASLFNDVEENGSSVKTLQQLLAAGVSVKVPLHFDCYGGDECHRKASNGKGRPGKCILCSECDRPFHINCLVAQGEMEFAADAEAFAPTFVCQNCQFFESAGGNDDDDEDEENEDAEHE
jgi:hypothetical protein